MVGVYMTFWQVKQVDYGRIYQQRHIEVVGNTGGAWMYTLSVSFRADEAATRDFN